MAETTGAIYEVIVWDCDCAPDAEEYFSENYTDEQLAESILPYFCAKRMNFPNLVEAKSFAEYQVKESSRFYVGAAVFQNGKILYRVGLTFKYREKYF